MFQGLLCSQNENAENSSNLVVAVISKFSLLHDMILPVFKYKIVFVFLNSWNSYRRPFFSWFRRYVINNGVN